MVPSLLRIPDWNCQWSDKPPPVTFKAGQADSFTTGATSSTGTDSSDLKGWRLTCVSAPWQAAMLGGVQLSSIGSQSGVEKSRRCCSLRLDIQCDVFSLVLTTKEKTETEEYFDTYCTEGCRTSGGAAGRQRPPVGLLSTGPWWGTKVPSPSWRISAPSIRHTE